MYDRILKQMRDKVRTRQYVMTLHAEEEMDEDGLSIFKAKPSTAPKPLWPSASLDTPANSLF